jgi:hypothetical protein
MASTGEKADVQSGLIAENMLVDHWSLMEHEVMLAGDVIPSLKVKRAIARMRVIPIVRRLTLREQQGGEGAITVLAVGRLGRLMTVGIVSILVPFDILRD